MSKDKKSFSFTNFLIAMLALVVVSFILGTLLNYFMNGVVSLTSDNTLTFTFLVFIVCFLVYIIIASNGSKDSKLKGKSDMENQHFASLRELDKNHASEVYVRCPETTGVSLAVYNRLIRSASFNIIEI